MLIKQDGNLRKRHYTHIYALYVCTFTIMYSTYISDVSKRGVLGSADDDLAFFLHIMTFFYWSWVDPLFFICFSLFWRCVSLFFIVFFQLYGTTESYIATLVERHGFQEKTRVPREKSGRHSNLIYLVLKPLSKNPGRHSVIFQYFEDVFHYCSVFFILKMVFIDVSLFWRCCSLFSMIFHYFQDVFHYFSLIFQCC